MPQVTRQVKQSVATSVMVTKRVEETIAPSVRTGSRSVVASPRVAPPVLSTQLSGMGPPAVSFSTVLGPREALNEIIGIWEGLLQRGGLPALEAPTILPLTPLVEEVADQTLRVARVQHGPDVGPAVVAGLRTALRGLRIRGVTVEEGYFFYPASQPVAVGDAPKSAKPWSVIWRPEHLQAVSKPLSIRLPQRVRGARFISNWSRPLHIMVIDTGDEGAQDQIGFEVLHTAVEDPIDHDGHGTTVGSLIRLVAAQAQLHSYRVVRQGNLYAESTVLLNALTQALTHSLLEPDECHIICVPQRAVLSTETGGQSDGLHLILKKFATGGRRVPILVCAAGNYGPGELMSYPAIVPGVVVAVALDWSGRVASYNCPAPTGLSPYTVGAPGGTSDDPLGTMARAGVKAKELYGSSYATALVSGALASR